MFVYNPVLGFLGKIFLKLVSTTGVNSGEKLDHPKSCFIHLNKKHDLSRRSHASRIAQR